MVTGANGQLGMSLRKISGGYPSHEFIFTDLPEGDITDADTIGRVVGDGVDVIVNCAAYTAVDRAESEREAAERVNAVGPAVLASVAARYGCRLVHISTDYVFGGDGCRPYTETDTPAPRSVYGCTKLAGEEAVRRSGADAVVVRTAWLYSEFGHNFVKTMLRLADEGKPLRVVDDQRGTPTYATDLARAVMTLVENGIKGFEVYHYTDGGNTTWYGFASAIFRMAGMHVAVEPIPTSAYPTPASRPAYSVLDTSMIMAAGAVVPDWQHSLGVCLGELGRRGGE